MIVTTTALNWIQVCTPDELEVTLAVTQKLIEQGRIPRDEEIVICITGNGLKTQDAVADLLERPGVIGPKLEEFDSLFEGAREPVLA